MSDSIDEMLERLDRQETFLDSLLERGRIPIRDYLERIVGLSKYREKLLTLKLRGG